jgi:hypothetical protein
MSTITAHQTVKDVLLPGDEPPPQLTKASAAAAKRGGVDAAIARLTPIGLDILGARIGRILGDLLGADVGAVIGSALTKHEKIAEARRTTGQDPNAEVVVTLAQQTFESTYTPAVDVIVDGEKLTSIPFEVRLAAEVDGGLVVVKGGRIAAVRTGRTTLSATLSCDGVKVVERTDDIDFAGVLNLPSADTPATRGVAGPVVTGVTAAPAPVTSPATPPVGLILNGHRLTASGTWERVVTLQPGDIVDGHRLNQAGTAWEPLP